MIIQCDACKTKFRLDDSKVTAKGVKVRCTKCQNIFVVMPTPGPEEAAPKQEEAFEVSFETKSEPFPKTTEIDFSKSSKQADVPEQEENKPEPSSWDMGGMDFAFEEKPKEEEKKSDWDIGFAPAASETPFSDEEKKAASQPEEEKRGFGFKIDEGPLLGVEKKGTASPPEAPDFGFDTGFMSAGENISFEIESPTSEKEFVASPTKEDANTVVVETPYTTPPPVQLSAQDEITKGLEDAKDVSFEVSAEKKPASKRTIIYAAILLLLLIGAGIFYLNTGTEFSGKTNSMAVSQKAMDIIGLNGYYINNASVGRLFVIEGKVVNNLNALQEVQGIHGIVFDKNDKQIKDVWVAPGRIISQDELKNISMADLGKRFNDRKGTMPPMGTVPFMIVFQSVSEDLAEFSVELVR
ncbi:MAG: zinc-ribbon domain-containing protein [Deltaproteobacteria bacterium]|nr:zinc-ribbon domain-containing protein [Deltaproteobacteria bacterium]